MLTIETSEAGTILNHITRIRFLHVLIFVLVGISMLALVLTLFLAVQNLEKQQLALGLNTSAANQPSCSWAILVGGLSLAAFAIGSFSLAYHRSRQTGELSQEMLRKNMKLEDEVEERQKAQKELMRQRLEYRTIFDSVPEIIAYTSSDGRIKRINRSGAPALGSTPKEVVGKTLHELLPSRLADKYLGLIKSVTDTDIAVRDHIVQYTLPSTRIIWSHTDVIPYRDLNGSVVGVICVVQDITANKTAEAALNESEQRYRSLFENNPDAVYSFDLEGNFVSVNNPTCNITGYDREELLKMSFDQIMAREDLETTKQHFRQASQGETRNYQTCIVNKNDKRIYLDVTNSPVTVDNRIVGVYGIARDITEQKTAQDAIAQTEAKFHSLAEETPGIIAIMLKTGRVAYINKKGPEILGYTREEICSPEFDFVRLFDPLDEERIRADFTRQLAGKENLSAEYKLVTQKGNRINIILNTRLITYDNDTAILGVITDITDRKRYEEKLSKSHAALKKSLNDAVHTMAKMVEIRDPYTAGHQNKVGILAKAIAVEMGLEENRIHWLQMAAKIHDVGKIYLPSDILSKPGHLSTIEFQLIKTHPKGGHDIVASIDFPFPVALAVLQHHERLDGSGYPFGLANGEISLEARIIAVADVVEAMSSHRPYRPALGIDKALQEISNNKGRLYDPSVVDACIKLFNERGFTLV